jgi:G3E family GTPase
MDAAAADSRIPVVIFAGFLGAGKTTFLREILPLLADGPRVPFVILNDFLDAEVDSAAVRELTREVRAIAAGCVCCDAADGLVEALEAIPATRPMVVLIEANGATDPDPLLEMLTTAPSLITRFGPVRQVAVLNEARWQKRWLPWDRKLERSQLRTASHIATNRGHVAPVRQQLRVRADIAALNPRARLTTPAMLAAEIATGDSPATARPSGQRGHAHHHAAARIALTEPLREEILLRWLAALPREILRVKGVAKLENGEIRHFQRTDDPGERPVMMRGSLAEGLEPCAILIGPGVDADAARELLAQVAAASPVVSP